MIPLGTSFNHPKLAQLKTYLQQTGYTVDDSIQTFIGDLDPLNIFIFKKNGNAINLKISGL
jgi:hypothetical protein